MSSFGKRRRAAFTLVELLTVLAIVVVLASLVFVGLGTVRQKAKVAQSLNNLRQVGVALNLYATDNKGRFPMLCASGWGAPFWPERLISYLPPMNKDASLYTNLPSERESTSTTMLSPLLENGLHMSLGDYGAYYDVIRVPGQTASTGETTVLVVADLSNPSRVVSVVEAQSPYAGSIRGSYYIDVQAYVSSGTAVNTPADRGIGVIPSLFCDGHVEAVPSQTFFDNRRKYFYINP